MKFLPLLLLSSLIQIPVVDLNQKPSIGIVQQTDVAKKAQVEQLNAEGEKLFNKGEYSVALAKFQQGLALAKKIGYKQAESISIDRIGELDRAQGKYLESIKSYQQSLAISQKIGYKIGESNTLNHLGEVYRLKGEYPVALKSCQQSLTISRSIDDKIGESNALNNLAKVYHSQGEYPQALEHAQQALTISKSINYSAGESNALNNIGENYRSKGEYPKALDYYQQSLNISQAIGYKAEESNTLNNMARVYRSLGQYPKALEYYQRSLKISEKIENKQGESTTLNNMGRVYSSLGQYQKALEYYQRSLEISEKIEYKQGSGATLNHMGEIHSSLKEYEKALEYYERSLKISRLIRYPAGERSTLNNMGRVYQLQGQYRKALAYYQPALDIGKKIDYKAGIGSTLNNMGEVYSSLGQYEQALKYYQESLDVTKKIRYPYIEATTLTNIGDALFAQNKPALAEQPLRDAIAIWENIRSNKDNSGKGLGDSDKLAFADRIPATYKLLQKVLIQQKKPQAALEISERGRARALAELLASRVTNTLKVPNAPNLAQIQQVARNQNATLVEYSLIDETIYMWVISPNGKINFGQSKLPPNTNIQDLVNISRNRIGVRSKKLSPEEEQEVIALSTAQAELKLLHKLLIVPISKYLPKDPNQRVIIIPQGELFFVPFVALRDSQNKYLIEQHIISTASSIGLLDSTPKLAKFNRKQGTALVVGNPIMPLFQGQRLTQLKGAGEEAISVGSILKTTPLIGAQADKKVVIDKMRSASIVHLATHGLLDKVEGDIPGAIALTNGFLTSTEIFDLKLKSDLVVLSACDTGRGDLSGDGVIGLSRALAVAGVPSVAVSLWQVDDDATKELMIEFYQNWYEQGMGKAQAMRQAMLKVMKTSEQPSKWAAFTIMGEAR
jgi:CHAT domain-containing protein/Tfp pilus assembly protein PilF